MKKKKRVEIKINFSKRWLYTFIVIGILAIVGIGVWAVEGVSHTSDELPTETDPTVFASVKDGVSWNELSGIPSGFADGVDDTGEGSNSLWTQSGDNIYYNNGNVGIGTENPTRKLDVRTTGGRNNPGIYSIGSTAIHGYGTHSSGYVFYAAGAGTKYGQSSSIRWKNNITEINNALDKVLNLRGIYFNWDEEHGGEHDIGMIAEEVGEYVPEVVVYEEDGIYANGMDYGALTPLLIEALKEQQRQINELKAELQKKNSC